MRLLFIILMSLLSFLTHADVRQYTLDNGLKIIVKEDHRAPVAVSMIWYNVGSADEPGGLTGVSHAIEHMMFKGTIKFPLGVFSKTVAAAGGQDNAFTNHDYTAYFEKVAANQLPVCFELEADRMRHLLLDRDEFAKEIKVIQEERRMRTDDNPQALAFERFSAAAHLAEPYHHPVIGWMSDLKEMRSEDVQAWYRSFYAPNNATLVVVGDVDPHHVYELAKSYFGDLTPKPVFSRKKQPEPVALGPKSVEIRASAQLPMLIFGYTVPSFKSAQNEWEPFALEVINGILDIGDNGRFAKNLIRGSHVASNTQIYYDPYARFQTQFAILATASQNTNLQDLRVKMLKEIKRLQTEPLSDLELNRIKTQIIAQKTFEKDSIFAQAMQLGLLETIGLGSQFADHYVDSIKAVTPAQIQEVAKRYFQDNTYTEARLIPTSPSKETL